MAAPIPHTATTISHQGDIAKLLPPPLVVLLLVTGLGVYVDRETLLSRLGSNGEASFTSASSVKGLPAGTVAA